MKNLKDYLFQKIDPQDLEKINGLKFTSREIDILAFMLHGKSTKKAAALLLISPRTVENHIRNIMAKIECNSREAIIDFIEKSKEISLLKKYYLTLRVEAEFKECLREISFLIKGTRLKCKIINLHAVMGGEDESQNLELYLKSVGIHILEKTGNDPKIISLMPSKESKDSLEYVVCPISTLEETHLSLIKEKFTLYFQNTKASLPLLIFLTPHGKSQEILSSVFLKENKNVVILSSQENEYLLIFELLKKMLPSLDLEKIRSKFIKRFQELTLTHETGSLQNKTSDFISNVPQSLQRKGTKWRSYLLTSLIFTGIFGLILFLSGPSSSALFERVKFSSKNIIRSDLPIPAETILLPRPKILEQIQDKLKQQQGIQVIALVGIGGAGKTTLARQYARLQKVNVIWEVNADTKESLLNSFEALVYALCKTKEEKKILREFQEIKNPHEREHKIIYLLKDKLKANSEWLLIYDNVEKFTDIQKYFPYDPASWGTGKVIITSRDNNIGNNNYINQTIHVSELNTREKLVLFNKIMRVGNLHHSEMKSKKFLDNIPPFPLDISTAAYYLKATNVSLEGYLSHLINYNKDFTATQDHILKEASDYTKTRYSIITLSLKKIIDTQKEFEELLLLISLLDSQNIPKALLDRYGNASLVDSLFYHLNKYSLIIKGTYRNSIPVFSMHRSTQKISLDYLKTTLNLERNDASLDKISHIFENYMTDIIDKEDFSQMKLLLSHGETYLKHNELIKDNIKDRFKSSLGSIYYYLSDYSKAKHLLEESLENLQKDSPKNDPKIAHVLMYLGNVYRSLGECETAKTLLEKSLSIYTRYPGNYLGKGRALGYLGIIYRNLSDYTKAINLLEESLKIYQAHSQNSIGHAWILSHLGNTHRLLGNYEQARVLLEQSLAIYRDHSEDYVGVSWVLGYLGDAYRALGDYTKAKSLLEQSLVICRKHFPENHVYIAYSLAYLGNMYAEIKDYRAAEKFLEKSFKILEKAYGKNHLQTARLLKSLGRVYLLEGQLQKAEDFLQKSLIIFQNHKYSESYSSLENLSDLYIVKFSQSSTSKDKTHALEIKNKAIAYLEKALEILQDHFPKDSSHLRRVQGKLLTLKNS